MNPSTTPADIGIDLGTTYSVIAIKGRVELDPNYGAPGEYREECDVTVIPSPAGDPTFPSVFWADPSDPTSILIGVDAKQKADDGDAPIMFSKRSIGTDKPLSHHGRNYSAKEIAEHILRYLKTCAERALGRPVRRAVITHPAYFDPGQIAETREAAIAAGFNMDDGTQMLMEPAAAALAFTQGNPKDPLTVLVYDLGGGTFDVTVLERRQGVISMKAFDGNHLLGGYNFDRALVQWVLDRLRTKGRNIVFNEGNVDDQGRRARMLVIAERVKTKLSEQRGPKVFVDFKCQDVLVDSEGRSVQVLERINREEFTALIKDELEETITRCRSALAKAEAAGSVGDPALLDEIVLVGGSSYGPWIGEAVSAAFGRKVGLPQDGDLRVAQGAALVAASLPKIEAGDGFEVIVNAPSSTPLPQITVSGEVRGAGGKPLGADEVTGLNVLLKAKSTGASTPVTLAEKGTFAFEDVPLTEEGAAEFCIEVLDAAGRTRVAKEFTVAFAPEATVGSTQIFTSLPRPIYLKTSNGLKLIAEEGVQLPAKCELKAKYLHDDDSIEIDVLQEDEEVGTMTVTGIPPDVGRGATVNISVEVTQQNQMKGTVSVETRAGAVVASGQVLISFPPLQVPDVGTLREEFDRLESERQQEAALSEDAERRILLDGKGRRQARQIEKLFGEKLGADRQEIHAALKEFRKLVTPPADDMKPPRAHFRRLVEECQEMLNTKSGDPQVQPLNSILKRIETKGNEAFNTKNHKAWASEYDNLLGLHGRLQKITGGGSEGGEKEDPPTPILKDWAKQQVDQLRTRLQAKRDELESSPRYATRFRKRLDDIERKIVQVDTAIEKIDDNLAPSQGRAAVQVALRSNGQIEKEITSAGVDVEI